MLPIISLSPGDIRFERARNPIRAHLSPRLRPRSAAEWGSIAEWDRSSSLTGSPTLRVPYEIGNTWVSGLAERASCERVSPRACGPEVKRNGGVQRMGSSTLAQERQGRLSEFHLSSRYSFLFRSSNEGASFIQLDWTACPAEGPRRGAWVFAGFVKLDRSSSLIVHPD